MKNNAKIELEKILYGIPRMICAQIDYDHGINKISLKLQLNYNMVEFVEFLRLLDFEYYSADAGFNGIVWLEDGSWLERHGDDDCNYWEHMSVPTIPEELKKQKEEEK